MYPFKKMLLIVLVFGNSIIVSIHQDQTTDKNQTNFIDEMSKEEKAIANDLLNKISKLYRKILNESEQISQLQEYNQTKKVCLENMFELLPKIRAHDKNALQNLITQYEECRSLFLEEENHSEQPTLAQEKAMLKQHIKRLEKEKYKTLERIIAINAQEKTQAQQGYNLGDLLRATTKSKINK